MKKSTTSFKSNEDTRIWCEYCRIFVYNNRINREKHDNSPQHQANFKKRVETIRREEEQQKRLQNDLVTKPATGTKSFYLDSKTKTQTQQPLNVLSAKSSSSVEKKKILGLSSNEPPVTSISLNLDTEAVEQPSRTTSLATVDIKSTASELKRKMKEDEKIVLGPLANEPEPEAVEVTLESLNVFKKKKK